MQVVSDCVNSNGLTAVSVKCLQDSSVKLMLQRMAELGIDPNSQELKICFE